ncbi:MAG: hypothetical protein A2Z47_06030 [Thermodesulfovibrio sp. RBG_19FT_COMBO_42_12]|nr:MAG: hypothetical protein A2Z47_06030 [Thermodesulfovibrio sp. RBG_19FT_COMBO_42_12]
MFASALFYHKDVNYSLQFLKSLFADCPDEFQGKAEGGFIGGFDKRLEGFFQFLMAFYMPIN